MSDLKDLKTTRLVRGLTLEGLADGIARAATLGEIENGLHLPHQKTRKKIESVIGPVSWERTLVQDRGNVMFALREFIQPEEPNALARIHFCRQALQFLTETIKK